ncbi:MAG TPA: hypothetical protein IGS53_06330 [Leptolyngbyaceae cyanobacterium M33_DOE_097]|uniref:Uncharacterized protein n=1 Tax=Oscillatoriales cyanobacterium SpSt-418 TaxID=2282169 RepID=A0A7C3PM20_9CYAN|nr:hypothetical protein [Leptolyngbyaceae cyanobacterium M33_DOE_097]
MVKFGLVLTIYFCLSAVLFLIASNTIIGAIIYFFLLLPFYVIALAWLWAIALQNRTQPPRIKYWIWGIVLALQVATILVSPGNCFRAKEGAPCYSNLQILLGNAPRSGPSDLPHWTLIEHAFPGLVVAYGVAILVGLWSVTKNRKQTPNQD